MAEETLDKLLREAEKIYSGAVYGATFREPEPPADCQDCWMAPDKCAEYRVLNRPELPYGRRHCYSYKPGRKGYTNPVQCQHCGTVYPGGEYFHPYQDEMYCCKCTGHKPGACIGEGKDNE